jgi:hypothetical protein
MRTLDDCYGADNDRFPLEQEACPPQAPLVWDEPRDTGVNTGTSAAKLAAFRLSRLTFA